MIPIQKKSIFARLNIGESGDEIKEMTFIDHLEALRWHLVRALIAWIVVAVCFFIFRDWIFDNIILAPSRTGFISYKVLCQFGHSLHMGQSLCMIGGLITAFPYIIFEFWKFIKPALSSKELKYSSKSIFWVSFCFFLGASFGYYILAPFTFNFLANFQIGTTGAYKYMPTLDDYISTLNNLLLGCGVAFELPVLAVVLAKIGLITSSFLKAYRRYAYILILILAAILTPSPDWISQAIVALPLLLLFEISIILVKKIDAKKLEDQKQWE